MMIAASPLIRLNLLPLWRRTVPVWGGRFGAVSLDRLVYLYLHRAGFMGSEEQAFFEQKIAGGMCVLDIGANLGLYTVLLSRLVGDDGSIISFEPDPDLFSALQSNCRTNRAGNVELHNVAAGARSGRMVLSRSLANAGDNRLSGKRDSQFCRPVEVRVATVDEIVGERRVDFVKLDVQGWEGEVLRGMQRVLRSNPRLQICFEYWPHGLRDAGWDPMAFLNTLYDQGFEIYSISGEPIGAVADWRPPGGKSFTNLYAVRRGRAGDARDSG
jgi:FkbM family methyltransferase